MAKVDSKKRQPLAGQVCIITGAVGQLGRVFSRACALAGATVIMADIDAPGGQKLVGQLIRETDCPEISFIPVDITKERSVKQLIKQVLAERGRIDALVNNAYPRNKNYGRKFEQVSYEDFCDNVSQHLGGYFLMTREVVAVMKQQRRGTIVNLGSIYGAAAPHFEIYAGTTMIMPVEYAAIKGGILNLTKYLASYLGKYNIRVNAVSPGGVFNNQPDSFVKKYSAKVRLGGRMANPADIVGAIIFLLSDASRYMTGQNLVVDGGWSL